MALFPTSTKCYGLCLGSYDHKTNSKAKREQRLHRQNGFVADNRVGGGLSERERAPFRARGRSAS